jgi:hypothetical protein
MVVAMGHSATVEMTLYIGSAAYPVLQSGGDEIKLEAAQDVPQGDAVLEIVVDGRVHRRDIRVIGSSSRMKWVNITER